MEGGYNRISVLSQDVQRRKAISWLSQYRPGYTFVEREEVLRDVLSSQADWQPTDAQMLERMTQGEIDKSPIEDNAGWLGTVTGWTRRIFPKVLAPQPSATDDLKYRIGMANVVRNGQRWEIRQGSWLWNYPAVGVAGLCVYKFIRHQPIMATVCAGAALTMAVLPRLRWSTLTTVIPEK